jgi:hypothetical protein
VLKAKTKDVRIKVRDTIDAYLGVASGRSPLQTTTGRRKPYGKMAD